MTKKHDIIILALTSLVCVATVLFLSSRDPNGTGPTSGKSAPGPVPPPGGGFVEEDESALKMLFLGSFHAGDNLAVNEKKENSPAAIMDHYTFDDLTGLLESADFALVGLCAPLISSPHGSSNTHRSRRWDNPQKTLKLLKDNNVSVVSLNGRHMLDFGAGGLTQTMNVLEKAGIQYIGAGFSENVAEAPYRFEAQVGDLPFHVAIFAPLEGAARTPSLGANSEEAERRPQLQSLQLKDLAARIDALKKAEPDLFVIVAPNWGRRFRWADKKQQSNARKLIDAGADIIIGHGSDMVQEIERYKDRWILYGIGSIGKSSPNDYKKIRKAVPYSFAVRLEVREKEGALHQTLRLYPITAEADRSKPGSRFLSAKEMGDFYWAMLEKTTRIDHWMKRNLIIRMDRCGRHLEILAGGAKAESE